ncbi:putative acid phosphatase [Monocercomonoides exilis]|uniref:putative acid phosphatase n=1 Tax=Monocercomonoides exilis TaxID=2049356 RepID=UPI003559FB46|nr:putative acid phosphatase [Monocercomonoides exilis]|eukprot:MONOS_14706.1-p1 / transcript=MONOS_14706.1 / gene=MONOS_14706 / organism=Monocercomonoides_exilis_PA203 / gene_product=acid phosphatase / transcript_product=acid phosphatase / location=Mono_scaffold01055:6164-8594(+) / protein_length=425 / sequence_SO=supercontig / SO=protein_coding / is_pseudo=false
MFLLLLFIAQSYGKMISVRVVERHGDRAPLRELPNVQIPDPLGELTQQGLNQLEKIGSKMREIYAENGIVPKQYDPRKFFFYTTHVDRTKMSQSAFAHGFFTSTSGPEDPDTKEPIFGTGLTPLPSHSVLPHNEYLLLSASRCKNALDAIEEGQKSDSMKQYYKDNAATLNKLFNQVGTTAEGYDITDIIDVLIYLNEHNLPFPGGMTKADFDEYMKIFDYLSVTYSPVHNKKFCDAATGMFMKKLLREVSQEVNSPPSDASSELPVFYHYHGHDWTINSVFGCLGLNNTNNPSYGSLIVIETHVDDNDQKKVYFKFKKALNVSKEAENLQLEEWTPKYCPAGKEYCDFDSFSKQWSPYWQQASDENWYKDVCGMAIKGSNTILVIILVVLAVVFALSLAGLIVLCVFYLKTKPEKIAGKEVTMQ